ncbi:hypothetical protein F8388_010501 [Cannabis sativa]|uniref:peroxidase n=1 Tax=Cannabis sativa TaxID=3483 RepID=A0A7J6GPS6_CANSA|nr:hypothetical protein G4B88_016851 [Cannabis sativa]KAF4384903.1 hypothetical protein F8388_010501 [Cannabis sativa]
MKGHYSKVMLILFIMSLGLVGTLVNGQGTRVGFYSRTCPKAESIKDKFLAKGLNTQDLVTLVGGHTIGTTACQLFRYRLYNFTTTGNGADPTINPSFLPQLRALCPDNGDGAKRVDMDTGSAANFDATFFRNLRNGRGVVESDQKLWTDPSTKPFVQRFLGERGLRSLNFNVEFGKSMVKMSNIGVKTGSDGEIRRLCTAFN